MASKTRVLQLILLAVVSAILIYHFRDYIWTESVDLAHHYSLVVRLTEFGHRSASVDPSLGEMQIYPPLSHYMAMWVGKAFGSPFIGMQLIALVCAIAIWAAIGWMFSSLPQNTRRFTSGLLVALLVLNGLFVHLEAFDRELVGNYFYSQLVGQAMAMIALAVALSLGQSGISRFANYVFLIFAMLLVESAHLLPAVELLGFLCLLVCSDLLLPVNRKSLMQIAGSFGLVLIATIAVIVHPTFRAMRAISENNGALSLNLIPDMRALTILTAIVALVSFALILRWLSTKSDVERKAKLVIQFFGLFGLAIAVLCVMQMLALAFGQGSEYACRKYAFALSSMLFVNLALLPVAFDLSFARRPNFGSVGGSGQLVDVCSIAAIVLVASLANLPQHKEWSLARLVQTERELNLVNEASVSHRPGLSNYAVRLPGSVPLLDYMFSIGIFKTPRTDNAYDILRNRVLSQPNMIGNIVTAVGTKPYDVVACRRPSADASLSVIDGACFVKSMPRRDECSGWFHMTPDTMLDYSAISGFSNPEAEGTWTDGKNAAFVCKMPSSAEERPKYMRIVAQAFVQPGHPQAVEVALNGSERKTVQFAKAGAQQIIELPVPAQGNQLKVEFSMPDAVSPESLGLSHDTRKLGLYVNWIQFSTHSRFQ